MRIAETRSCCCFPINLGRRTYGAAKRHTANRRNESRRTFETGPIDIGFETDDDVSRLDLCARRSTDDTAGEINRLFVETVRYQVQWILVSPSVTAVQSDVNSGPIVDWRRRHQWGRSRPSRQVCR